MVKSLLTASFNTRATTAGATQYWILGTAPLTLSATEANVAVPYRSAGTFSKLYIRVTANTTSASSTLVVRKNGADQALTLTIPAATAGVFEDTTNTFSITAGDLVNYKTVSGGTGVVTISLISVIFDATTNCVSKLIADGVAHTSASASRFHVISGANSAVSSSGTTPNNTIRKVATFKNHATYVSANARTTNTVFTLRKNAVDSTVTVTFGNVETGLKEDSTHTSVTAANDVLDYKTSTGTGTETLTTEYEAIEAEHATDCLVSASSLGASADQIANFATTWYMPIGGSTQIFSSEANTQQKPRAGFIISELTFRTNVNTLDGACVVTLRKNGADTALTVTMTAGSTTPVTDSTHTVSVGSNDDINLSIVSAGTTGAITLRQIAVWLKTVPERSLSDSITISEPSMIRRTARLRTSGAETVTISETRNRVNGAVRAMAAQTVTISDSIAKLVTEVGGVIEKIITETAITVSSSIARLKRVWRLQPP